MTAAAKAATALGWMLLAPMGVAMPASGTGSADDPEPRSVAEVEARHAQTVRQCNALGTAAVRRECLKVAKADRERALARLGKAASAPP